jgi:choline dehydrogenase-like flavoprotein
VSDLYDVCIIGSGAGGGATAAALSRAGKRVLILEKGPWFDPTKFYKDEVVQTRRKVLVPDPVEQPMVEESADAGMAGAGTKSATYWNGSLVGGSSVLMSGFMMRMKPDDFRARSVYGDPPADQGIHLADWPITYDELEPYYARVESELGISGRIDPATPPTLREPRSTADFPQSPTKEHPFAQDIDRVGRSMGLNPIPLPRAVLSKDRGSRKACDDNGFCGYSVCTTNAKGSSLAHWVPSAVAAGAEVRPHAMVRNLVVDASGRNVVAAEYFDKQGKLQRVRARAFVVACQAIESARLLLNSRSPKHPQGLANGSGLVGRNLLFATYGAGWGDFPYGNDAALRARLRSPEPFINRVVQDYYWYDPKKWWERTAANTTPQRGMVMGGTINFLLPHPYPIGAALNQSFEDYVDGRYGKSAPPPLWGPALKKRLHYWFREQTALKYELFGVWYPHDGAHVSVSPTVKDKWGTPVSNVRAFNHVASRINVEFLANRALDILRKMGAKNPRSVRRYGGPSTNLIGGTCRFGDDPRSSVLDRDCRAHEAENLYVADASFMPTGGRVPFTFTIYANALRIAETIAKRV